MNIQQTGNTIIVTLGVNRTHRALQHSTGKIDRLSLAAYETDKKADSWVRSKDPGVKFGVEETAGLATITFNVDDLVALADRAAHNKNKTAKQGVARAKFTGRRDFIEEAI